MHRCVGIPRMRAGACKRLGLVLGGLLAAELTAAAGLAMLGEGRGAVAAARERVLRSGADHGADRDEAVAATAPGGPGNSAYAAAVSSPIVLQPYLGYVLNPEIKTRRSHNGYIATDITEDGFEATADPPAADNSNDVEVGLFGGSVAAILCAQGHDALLAALARFPGFRGKRLALRCFALGGYKQPQQLIALAYFLALGRKLDLAINLDGFNEVALASGENWPSGVFPFYPRGWSTLVEGLPDIQQLRLVGAIVDLEDRRVRLARAFSRIPWRYSAIAGLLWKALDRRLAASLGEIQTTLQHTASAGRGRYLGHGPRVTYRSEEDLFRDLAAEWMRSSLEMAHLAAGAGIRYYHFLQPNQYDPGGKPLGAAERRIAYRTDHPYRKGVEQGYPLLARAGLELASGGVRFYDARKVFATHSEPLYIDQCCHFNQKGSQILAAWMGARIVQDLEQSGGGGGRAGPAATPGSSRTSSCGAARRRAADLRRRMLGADALR
jgi:hypothetical protein